MRALPPGGTPRLAIAIVCLVFAAAACAPASTTPPASSSAAPPSAKVSTPTASEGPISPVVGTVTAVSPAAQASPASPGGTFSEVTGFTLLTSGGETLTFKIGELDNAADFPDYQLYDRLTSGDPILVFFEIVGNDLVVYHIEDAG